MTPFARFLRHGGRPHVTLRAAPEHKDAPTRDERRTAFMARLARAAVANALALRDTLEESLGSVEALDPSPFAFNAVMEWEDTVARLSDPSDRARVEDAILQRFAADLNEARQGALGIASYRWRTRDDPHVRPAHAERDGEAFAWDEPPPGGHPGEDWGCRCWAEPVPPDPDDGAPLTGLALAALRARAEAEGVAAALADMAAEAIAAPGELLDLSSRMGRWAGLRLLLLTGFASAEDERELQAMERAAAEAADRLVATARDAPALAAALWRHIQAVDARPEEVAALYARGLATEGDLAAAYRERSYLNTNLLAVAVGVALSGGGFAAQLLRRAGRADVPDDPDALAARLAERTAALSRIPGSEAWPVIDNPGIAWGQGIRRQGIPWEDALEARFGDDLNRLSDTFPVFDFVSPDLRIAVSAKTLDLGAPTYAGNPRAIYSQLRGYVDRVARDEPLERGEQSVDPGALLDRRIEIAVPNILSDQQEVQLRRAVEYAADRGVNVVITRTR